MYDSIARSFGTLEEKEFAMLKLWMSNNVVFMIQVWAGMVAYLYSHNTMAAFIAACVAAFASISLMAIPAFGFTLLGVAMTAVAAAATVFALTGADLPASVLFAVATLVVTALNAAIVAKDDKEPFLPCLLAALPAGIGTVLGGFILLARWMKTKTA